MKFIFLITVVFASHLAYAGPRQTMEKFCAENPEKAATYELCSGMVVSSVSESTATNSIAGGVVSRAGKVTAVGRCCTNLSNPHNRGFPCVKIREIISGITTMKVVFYDENRRIISEKHGDFDEDKRCDDGGYIGDDGKIHLIGDLGL